jgi:hypothetical protein
MACGVGSGAGRQHRVADTGEVFGAFEHAVHDAAVIMDRAVAGGAEAVDAAHRAKACVRCGAASLAQIPFDDRTAPVEILHGRTCTSDDVGVTAERPGYIFPNDGLLLSELRPVR